MITLPRTLSGLLRRGAPVIETTKGTANHGERGVVIEFPAGLRVAWASSMITSITYGSDLDLDDPAGRDLAMRWAQEVHDLPHQIRHLREAPAKLRLACLILANRDEAPEALRDFWTAWTALPEKAWRPEWDEGTQALFRGDGPGVHLAAQHLQLTRNWKPRPLWPERVEAALAALATAHNPENNE